MRIVGKYRSDPNQHGIGGRPDAVDPIEVLRPGDPELLATAGRELSVDALCSVDDDVHAEESPGARMDVSVPSPRPGLGRCATSDPVPTRPTGRYTFARPV